LVDDEEGLRFTFEMLLNRAGYSEVKAVSGFEEAIAALKEENFDLVISDIVLEGASGIDILRQVKESGQNCPVVMITGYPSIETATDAVRLSAFDYLPKPVKKQALLDVVARALSFRAESLAEQKKNVQIKQEQERQQSIWQSLPELVITVNSQQQVVAMNDAALRWSREWFPELEVGKAINNLPEPLSSGLRQSCSAVLEKGEPLQKWTVGWLRPDRLEGKLQMAAALMRSEDSLEDHVVFTAHDISHLANQQTDRKNYLQRLIGASTAMHHLFDTIRNVGGVDATVLICGESGTGKELVAEALHYESRRRKGPLVKVDCTAIPDNLLESELFGHRRGAFTGAVNDREGRLLQANGGTLFLDEIGDISPRMQLRLLHFLQEQNFYPVGRDQPVSVDVRIIAATNADLKRRVEEGIFREDLYFRLRVVDIDVPPLRQRNKDIHFLADHFLNEYGVLFSKQFTGFSDQAAEKLKQHGWPGNVRELKHVIERAAVLSRGGVIVSELLQLDSLRQEQPASSFHLNDLPSQFDCQGKDAHSFGEAERILQALRHAGGNKAKAARMLGIDRSTLYRKMATCALDQEMIAEALKVKSSSSLPD